MKNSTALETASLRKIRIPINSDSKLNGWQVIQIKELQILFQPILSLQNNGTETTLHRSIAIVLSKKSCFLLQKISHFHLLMKYQKDILEVTQHFTVMIFTLGIYKLQNCSTANTHKGTHSKYSK